MQLNEPVGLGNLEHVLTPAPMPGTNSSRAVDVVLASSKNNSSRHSRCPTSVATSPCSSAVCMATPLVWWLHCQACRFCLPGHANTGLLSRLEQPVHILLSSSALPDSGLGADEYTAVRVCVVSAAEDGATAVQPQENGRSVAASDAESQHSTANGALSTGSSGLHLC